MPERYYALLQELQTVEFVCVELNLYLDTHPHDVQAIEQYNQFAHKLKELKHRFELEFGPLKHFGHSYSRAPWQWVETPWPWQV
ncbi:spore coat protein CotJB [Paenibacillus xerothermodurans]